MIVNKIDKNIRFSLPLVIFFAGMWLSSHVHLNARTFYQVGQACSKRFKTYRSLEKEYGEKKLTHSLNQRYGKHPHLKRDEKVLYVHGYIGPGVLKELKKNQTRLIVLNSRGGSSYFMMKIADYINTNKIVTYIPPGAKCFSACAFIFASGHRRIMGEDAKLMFHTARFIRSCHTKYRARKYAQGSDARVYFFNRKLARKIIRVQQEKSKKLQQYLGTNFVLKMHHEITSHRTYKSPWGNILGYSDYYIDAQTALKQKIVDSIDGTIWESFVRLGKQKVIMKWALKNQKTKKTRKRAGRRPSYVLNKPS